MINRAERIVVIDMFLFNAFCAWNQPVSSASGAAANTDRPQARGARVARRAHHFDPVNTVYGGMKAAHRRAQGGRRWRLL